MSRKDSHHHGNLSCSFCGKGQREVRKLIAGPTVYICDECIKLCNDIIAEESEREENRPAAALPAPLEIKKFLDDYMVEERLDIPRRRQRAGGAGLDRESTPAKSRHTQKT